MTKLVSSLILTAAVIILAFAAVWNAPVSLWTSGSIGGARLTALAGSDLGRGSAILDVSTVPGYQAESLPIWIEWNWCPRHGVASWCLRAEAESLMVSADINLLQRKLSGIEVDQLGARWLTPYAPALVNFELHGNVSQIEIGNPRCPSVDLLSGSGELQVRSVTIAGTSIADHQISIADGEGLNAQLSGPDASGKFSLQDRYFAWHLIWEPQSENSLHSVLPALLRSGDPLELSEEGSIPC